MLPTILLLNLFISLQKQGWACSKLRHRDCTVMLNVSSHVDVAKEAARIGAKIQKLERDLKKLESSLPKAKFTENLTQVIEAKISAVKEELKHLQDQIVFLDSIQSIKQSRN